LTHRSFATLLHWWAAFHITNVDFYISGKYLEHEDIAVQDFGDAFIETLYNGAQEDATDTLVKLVLKRSCPIDLQVHGRLPQFVVSYGNISLVSTPDASVTERCLGFTPGQILFLVAENASDAAWQHYHHSREETKEYQIPGEMLVAAVRNYLKADRRLPVITIFCLRVVQRFFAFYRADFPAAYLESFLAGIRPTLMIGIWRFTGHDELGIGVSGMPNLLFGFLCKFFVVCRAE
jgi:hypothetical protein